MPLGGYRSCGRERGQKDEKCEGKGRIMVEDREAGRINWDTNGEERKRGLLPT